MRRIRLFKKKQQIEENFIEEEDSDFYTSSRKLNWEEIEFLYSSDNLEKLLKELNSTFYVDDAKVMQILRLLNSKEKAEVLNEANPYLEKMSHGISDEGSNSMETAMDILGAEFAVKLKWMIKTDRNINDSTVIALIDKATNADLVKISEKGIVDLIKKEVGSSNYLFIKAKVEAAVALDKASKQKIKEENTAYKDLQSLWFKGINILEKIYDGDVTAYIGKGNKNVDEIKRIQQALVFLQKENPDWGKIVYLGASGFLKNGVDGDFGDNTEISLGKVQEKVGLSKTGIVDKETITKLDRILKDEPFEIIEGLRINPNEDNQTVSISNAESQLIDKLDGLEGIFNLYSTMLDQMDLDAYSSGFAAMYGSKLYVNNATPQYIAFEQACVKQKITTFQFMADVRAFEDFFGKYSSRVALLMLDNSKAHTLKELMKYGYVSDKDNKINTKPKLDGLYNRLPEIKKHFEDITALENQLDSIHKEKFKRGNFFGSTLELELIRSINNIKEKVIPEEVSKLAQDYPLIAYYAHEDKVDELKKLIYSSDKLNAFKELQNATSSVFENINKVKNKIEVDKTPVWDIPNVIFASEIKLGIIQGSIFDLIIQRKIQKDKVLKSVKDIFLASIQIALGTIATTAGATGVGAPIAALAGAGALLITGYTTYKHHEEYEFQKALVGSSYDRAMALSQEEPSLWWLAFDLAGLVFDGAVLAKAFKNLSPFGRGILNATEEERNAAITAYREAVKAESTQLFKKVTDQERFVRKLTDKLKDSDYVNNLILQTRRRAQLLDKYADLGKDLLKLYPGLSDIGLVGALRLKTDPNLLQLSKVLTDNFGSNQQVIRSFFYFAGESDKFLPALDKLRLGLGNDNFIRLTGHYMKLITPEGRQLLRYIDEITLTAEDYTNIIKSIKEAGTGKISSSAVLQAFAKNIGGGTKGTSKMLEISEIVHSKQLGTLFEEWAIRNLDWSIMGGKPLGTKTIHLVSKNWIKLDNYYLSSGGTYVYELKNIISGSVIKGEVLDQAKLYKSAIRNPNILKNQSDKILKVKYLFSTKDAATTNYQTLKSILENDVEIFFVNEKGIIEKLII
jgi:hypothetical protein